MLKFKDFSRTLKVAFSMTNSWWKFTACAVEQQYLIYIYAIFNVDFCADGCCTETEFTV